MILLFWWLCSDIMEVIYLFLRLCHSVIATCMVYQYWISHLTRLSATAEKIFFYNEQNVTICDRRKLRRVTKHLMQNENIFFFEKREDFLKFQRVGFLLFAKGFWWKVAVMLAAYIRKKTGKRSLGILFQQMMGGSLSSFFLAASSLYR